MATISGHVIDTNGNGLPRRVRAYRRDTGDLVGSAMSNTHTGEYSIETSHAGEHQVVMLDDDIGTMENDQIVRVAPV